VARSVIPSQSGSQREKSKTNFTTAEAITHKCVRYALESVGIARLKRTEYRLGSGTARGSVAVKITCTI
jgi:hypothetical protein